MKVYRLEVGQSGLGPFLGCLYSRPSSWGNSHLDPFDFMEYSEWIAKHFPKNKFSCFVPGNYLFAFNSLEKLKECFPGYENYHELILKEIIIDTSQDSFFLVLPDGQVLFSEIIFSTVLEVFSESI